MARAGTGRPSATSPAAERKAYRAEANLAWVRFAVIAFNIASYWMWFAPLGNRNLAITVSIVASLYGVAIVTIKPYLRFPVLLTAAWTAVTDGILITLWIHATGDFDSPYHLLWFLSLVAVTFRYDGRATALAGLAYLLAYSVLLWSTDSWAGNEHEIIVRLAYITLVAAAGALLARESRLAFDEAYDLGVHVQEAERFRALANASPEPLVIHRDGQIIEANRAFAELVGRRVSQVVGTSILEYLALEDRGAGQDRVDNPVDAPLEIRMPTPRGTRVVRVTGRPYEHEGKPSRVLSLRDVTEERAAQESAQHAMRAEIEVNRLKEMDRFKSEFINAAAHELNTPLTPLRLQLHMLAARLPERERRTVEILQRNLNRLGDLVQEMLDVARLESGRIALEVEPLDARELLEETCESFAELARARGMEVTLVAPAKVPMSGDTKRLSQVFYNLVSNALKFTPDGGKVRIEAGRDGSSVFVSVQDSGVGLTPQQAGMLFQPFSQAHRDELAVPGTGLGLYISKGIVERHGGTIEATSPGRDLGSTFTVRLPAAGPKPA